MLFDPNLILCSPLLAPPRMPIKNIQIWNEYEPVSMFANGKLKTVNFALFLNSTPRSLPLQMQTLSLGTREGRSLSQLHTLFGSLGGSAPRDSVQAFMACHCCACPIEAHGSLSPLAMDEGDANSSVGSLSPDRTAVV